jgi:hypothetical protein
MIRIASVLALVIAAVPASAQRKPVRKAEPTFSVCDLRSEGGFAKFYDEIVTVTGEVDATPDLTLLVSRGCDQAVQLVESESLRKQSSPILESFRSGIEEKTGCRDERPFQVALRGKLEMSRGAGDLLYTFRVTRVLKVEFLGGRSLNCPVLANPGPTPLHWLFPEPLDMEGRIVAYDWAADFFPGFENIHIEHFVVRVERVFNGPQSAKYIRVDFWGAPHIEDYRLPSAIFEKGHLWRMYLVPPSAATVSKETCQPDVDLTVTNVDEDGKEIEKEPSFRSLETVADLPDFRSLPCYVLRKQDLSLVP